MKALCLGLMLCCTTGAANAGLSQHDLTQVALSPPPNASVPLGLVFHTSDGRTVTLRDAFDGRPVFFLLADFTCRSICGPALVIAAGALEQTGLLAGVDFNLVVVGLDPKDTSDDARSMLRRIGNPDLAAATRVLTGDRDSVSALTAAVGYSFAYDAAVDQFAHPAGALVLTAAGRVSRTLSSLALNPRDLRLALVEAGNGHVGTLVDRLTLVCYGFNAAQGIYTLLIWRLLEIASILTVLGLAVFFAVLRRRVPREPSREASP